MLETKIKYKNWLINPTKLLNSQILHENCANLRQMPRIQPSKSLVDTYFCKIKNHID